jgi:hypothetical protein
MTDPTTYRRPARRPQHPPAKRKARKPPHIYEEKRAEAARLAWTGLSLARIAARLSLGRSTVSAWAAADGFRRADLIAAVGAGAPVEALAIPRDDAQQSEAPAPAPQGASPIAAAGAARTRALTYAQQGRLTEAEADMREARRMDRLAKFLDEANQVEALRAAAIAETLPPPIPDGVPSIGEVENTFDLPPHCRFAWRTWYTEEQLDAVEAAGVQLSKEDVMAAHGYERSPKQNLDGETAKSLWSWWYVGGCSRGPWPRGGYPYREKHDVFYGDTPNWRGMIPTPENNYFGRLRTPEAEAEQRRCPVERLREAFGTR